MHAIMEDKERKISRREKQIIEKIMEGLPNKLIADQLCISEQTVKFHCTNIYRKLNIYNRAKLIVMMHQA